VIEKYGRRVGRCGFGFYWGGLSFFVDSTDALLLPRQQRIVQAIAGPLADLLLAGALAVSAQLIGPGQASGILATLAVTVYLSVMVNLVPLLELDGYWCLADLLDRPTLRRDSMHALRHPRQATEPSHRLLATYGLASITFGGALVAVGVYVWGWVLWPIALDAWSTSVLGKTGAVALLAPVVVGVLAPIVQYARAAATRGVGSPRTTERG
jgi:putative peptide zinc metalloprotease protein